MLQGTGSEFWLAGFGHPFYRINNRNRQDYFFYK